MFKWIMVIKRKKGISHQEFMDYYETKHAPMIRGLLPKMDVYRRNYLTFDDPMFAVDNRGGDDDTLDFDVITEVIFGTREEAEAFMAAVARPENFEKIKADEDKFVEPGCAKVFVVQVCQSPIP